MRAAYDVEVAVVLALDGVGAEVGEDSISARAVFFA